MANKLTGYNGAPGSCPLYQFNFLCDGSSLTVTADLAPRMVQDTTINPTVPVTGLIGFSSSFTGSVTGTVATVTFTSGYIAEIGAGGNLTVNMIPVF